MSYNLTDEQKDLLRRIVALVREGGEREFLYAATFEGESISFDKLQKEIPAKDYDLDALAEEGFVSYTHKNSMGARLSLRRAGELAVASDFSPPAAAPAAPSLAFHGPVASVQTGDHAHASVTQNLSGVAEDALARLDKVQDHISRLAQQDLQLGTYVSEVMRALDEVRRDPEAGKGKLAALLESGVPYVEFATAIAELVATFRGGK